MVDTLPGSPEPPAAQNRLVAEIRPRLSGGEFLDVMLIDPQTGQVIAATDSSEEGKFKEDQLFFLNGRTGPYVQNLYYSLALQGPAMTAAAPLHGPDGRLLDVLAGRLDLAEINAIIARRTGLHQTDDAYLVNTSNLFVTQPRLLPDPGVLQRGVHSQAVDRCLQQNNGIAEVPDYRDIPAIVIYRWLPEQGLCLIVKMDQAEAYAPARAFGGTVAAISALALLVAAILAVVLARSISGPVLALRAGAIRFGRGELEVRLPETSRDELGELAREFNTMAAALEEKENQLRVYSIELEDRVAERTAELLRSEEALREREQTLASIYNTAADVIFHLTVAPEGRYRFASVNQAFCSTTGLNYDQVVGKYVDEIIPELSLSMVLGKYAEAIREQKIVCWEETSDYPTGRLTGEVSVAPVFDADGKCTHLVGTVHDITERKRAEEQIHRLNEELEQRVLDRTAQLEAANKELEAFAYSVSHDLRAPLRHIDGFIEMLQKRASASLDDKSQHYLVTIAESARQMGTLIDDLLTFSRMGRSEMFKTQVELGTLATEVIKEAKADVGERSIQWHVADLPSVNGDRAMLRVVFLNLIANALKFTRHNESAQVEIGCIQDNPGEVTVFVRDNGVGFDMKYVDKLFNVFQRLHRVEEFEGTGIGLANVRRIINRHGGRTWAEGEVGQGATFYFSLPTSE
jgi:PAS domain S-box-containing protein